MGCCGQNRQAWREWNASEARAAAPNPPVLQNPTLLRHTRLSSLVVKGAVTGNTYLFGGQDTTLSIDERDVAALIATGKFVVVSSENNGRS